MAQKRTVFEVVVYTKLKVMLLVTTDIIKESKDEQIIWGRQKGRSYSTESSQKGRAVSCQPAAQKSNASTDRAASQSTQGFI